MAEAGAEAITEFLTDQFCFSIDNLEGPLRTVGNTKPAAIAFLLINLYNLSRRHDFSSRELFYLKNNPLLDLLP
jgi:hypothetical protein